MKTVFYVVVGLVLVSTQVGAEQLQTFRSPMDKVNYGIGVEVIRNFKNQGVEIDLDMVIKGMKDGLSGNIAIPEKDLRQIMTAFQTELRQKRSKNKTDSPSNK
jgi:UDP-GlcNAc:undecaprenyl-phosphate/decaprenyl-phosphate GlcNAc-1-phosphate transferase